MFIKKVHDNKMKKTYISVVESFRDKDSIVRHRIVKKVGAYEDLILINPNFMQELEEEVYIANRDQKTNIEIDFNKLQSKSIVNYGYSFIEREYNKLNIEDFINDYIKTKSFKYDLNSILKLLIFSRILNPSSKLKSFSDRVSYFFSFKDIKIEEVYKSLDQLTIMKDELMVHINSELVKQDKRDVSLVFYDVTNYYFESEVESELRSPGVSKEKRNTPIVQMGLFIDKQGLPITYELFNGAVNDLSTMKPILEKIKRDYNLGSITIVADKGNNSSSNLEYIDSNDDYYIISQRIRNRGHKLVDIVLDDQGYQYNQDRTLKFKTVTNIREYNDSTIEEHIICFWSKEEDSYQKHKRGDIEQTIMKFKKSPALLNASNTFGLKKYFKKYLVDRKTGGTLKNVKSEYDFNQVKYDRDCQLDGYYVIVTNNLSLTPFEVIETYHGLSKIEESFKITKTDLEGRPIYVWTDNHIKGHFLTCYLSLLILRLIQLNLDNLYSTTKIIEALNTCLTIELEKRIYKMNKTSNIIQELLNKCLITFNKEYYKEEELNRIIKKITILQD